MLRDKLRAIWNVKELRMNLLFVLLMVFFFRVAAHIPVPGVNSENLRQFFDSNQVLGLLNIFSGGGIETFSVVALGIAPYITASIIFQLLAMIIPRLEELQKEPGGYAKISTWTRWTTVPLAFLQAFGLITLLQQQSHLAVFPNFTPAMTALAVLTIAAGTILLMWFGELIDEKNIGSGISIIIFAGIIAALPGVVTRFIATYDPSQLFTVIVFCAVALITIITVVLLNEATRNIPVTYARHVRGGAGAGVTTHLPLKVNASGMIPIIFAISLVLFPPLIAQFTANLGNVWVREASLWVIQVFQNQTVYGVLFFTFVFIFTYFYSSVVFKPQQIAENLQHQGGFVPGIRPGEHTEKYLTYVANRILFTGALFLSTIAVLPIILQESLGTGNLILGSASILIVVAVVIDMVKKVEAQLTMRDYDL
jgi:preprotein translocase subunit SecY